MDVEVEMEMDMEMEKDPLDIKPMMQEIEEYIILEEDPKCMPWLAWSLWLCLRLLNFKIVVVNDLNSCGPITF